MIFFVLEVKTNISVSHIVQYRVWIRMQSFFFIKKITICHRISSCRNDCHPFHLITHLLFYLADYAIIVWYQGRRSLRLWTKYCRYIDRNIYWFTKFTNIWQHNHFKICDLHVIIVFLSYFMLCKQKKLIFIFAKNIFTCFFFSPCKRNCQILQV